METANLKTPLGILKVLEAVSCGVFTWRVAILHFLIWIVSGVL